MQSSHSERDEGYRSDPSAQDLSPLHGGFSRLSGESRSRSVSPRKRHAKQPLHIRMNLTEMQMDRITEAVTQKVVTSPARLRSPAMTPSPSPERTKSRPHTPFSFRNSEEHRDPNESTTFSALMPSYDPDPFAANLAERRRKEAPPSIRVGSTRAPGMMPRRSELEAVSALSSPLSPADYMASRPESDGMVDSRGTSSIYGPDPLSIHKKSTHDANADVNREMLQSYNRWTHLQSPSVPSASNSPSKHRGHRVRRSRSIGDGLKTSGDGHPQYAQYANDLPPVPQMAYARPQNSPLFSPLALYFRGNDFPNEKKGGKTLIGQNGWLERVESVPTRENRTVQKKAGILDSIKKIAKDMTDLSTMNKRPQQSTREVQPSRMHISLDAREQSLLCCELEYHLTSALNDFMTSELDRGRLSPANLKRIADAWAAQGRPRVVAFRYDLETQLDLVALHASDFTFRGRRQGQPTEIAGLLAAMRTNARAMRVRTFCQPDSVVAKWLVDSQSLFNMVGAGRERQIALAEVAQFFKVIVERERDARAEGKRE